MANKVLLKKSSTASKVPLTTDLDYGELALNYTDGKLYFKNASNLINSFSSQDKYHVFPNNTYYFDNYEQTNFLRLFTQNATSDTIRYKTVTSPEYYDYTSSTWTAWSAGLSGIQQLLDGNPSTGIAVGHTNRTFRFIVSGVDGYPTGALVLLQSTWSAITYTTATVTIATSTTLGGTYTSRQVMTFSPANTGNNWGMHGYYTGALHTGDTFYQITIDLTDWVDSNSYVTYPLRNLGIFSNYSTAGGIVPYTTGYNKYTNFIGGISTPADVQGGLSIGRYDSGGTSILDTGSNATSLVFRTQYNTQFAVSNTASAVNYVQVNGAPTTGAPIISVQGSDTNISQVFQSKGTGTTQFNGNGGTHLRIRPDIANATQFWEVFGSTGSPILRSTATSAQIQVSTGYLSIQTTTAGTEQLRVSHTASAVNYLDLTGSVTTGTPSISAQGSDTHVGLLLQTKNAGTMYFSKYRDAVTSNTFVFANAGGLTSDGAGAFWRGHHIGAPAFTVSSANKFLRLSSYFELDSLTDPTYKNVYTAISNGSGLNVEHNFVNDTGGGWIFRQGVGQGVDKSFKIATPLSTDRNYLQVAGAAASAAPVLSAQGSDANISQVFQSKGTGAIDLAAGSSGINISNGGTVTAITKTPINYGFTSNPAVVISAPTTAGGVTATANAVSTVWTMSISNAGTGYTVGDVLTAVGGTGTPIVVVVSALLGATTAVATFTYNSYGFYSTTPTGNISFTGGTGTGFTTVVPSWSISTLTITNAGSGYVEQPTITFTGGGSGVITTYATVGNGTVVRGLGSNIAFSTSGGEQVRIVDAAGPSVNYLRLGGSISGGSGSGIAVRGTDANTSLNLSSNGSGNIDLFTTGDSFTRQFRVAHTASAVNYVQVTGSATGNQPVISVQGSDTNITFNLASKGTASIIFNANSAEQFRTGTTASAVNSLQLNGATTGNSPSLQARGTNTDIDLTLSPKGSGKIVVSSAIQIDANLVIDTLTATTTATTADQVLVSLDATVYRAVKFLIRAVDATGTKYHTTEILAIHNGTTANYTEYGSVNINGVCATFSVDYSASTMRLLATPSSANSTTFVVAVQLLK